MMQLAHSPKYLMHWDHQCDQRLLRDVVSTTHRLAELPVFSDEGLSELIDHYPAEAMMVMTMGHNPAHASELQYGVFDDIDGRQWIEMIRRGRLCLRLTQVAQHSQELAEIVRRLSGEMMECQPGLRTRSHDGDLWISSPYTIHYFGIDRDPHVFWQIRGHRKVTHYPLTEPFVLDRTLEQVVANGQTRPLYFEPAFDQQAQTAEQVPGDVLGLPLHTPYRIATSGTLSLTLTTTYQTRQTQRQNEVLMANAQLNRWLPNQDRSVSLTGPKAFAKRMLVRVVSQFAGEVSPPPYEPTFRVDPLADHCVGDIDAEPTQQPETDVRPTIPIFPGLANEVATYAPTGTEI